MCSAIRDRPYGPGVYPRRSIASGSCSSGTEPTTIDRAVRPRLGTAVPDPKSSISSVGDGPTSMLFGFGPTPTHP